MNRRGFLSLLGASAAGFVLDPELLLWKPGAKTIFLPSIVQPYKIIKGDIITFGPGKGLEWVVTGTYDAFREWPELMEGMRSGRSKELMGK